MKLRRLLTTGGIAALLVLGVGLLASPNARAADGIEIKDFTVEPSTSQAGGHPDLHVFLWLSARTTDPPTGETCGCQDLRNVKVQMPTGLIGVPQNLPRCSAADFAERQQCPIDAQVGWVRVGVGQSTPGGGFLADVPIFNLEPRPNQVALIGFNAPAVNSPIFMVASARTESDYGVDIDTVQILHTLAINYFDMTLWGVPASPANDERRMGPIGCNPLATASNACQTGFPSNSPEKPFFNNPTTCGVPLQAIAEVGGYDFSTDQASSPFPGTTGCEQLSFNPSLFGRPTTGQADAPSGFDVDLDVPQTSAPDVPSPSSIRASSVTLPDGFSINAGAADGKAACTDAQANLSVRTRAAECPEEAKVGTLRISSDSLPGPLPGYIYIAEPRPGNRYRIVLAANGFGLHVKLFGSVMPDPRNGRLTVVFEDLPQFPFSNFNMHFFGSERGFLATPTRCGTYAVDSTFTPWNAALPEQSSQQFFRIESGPGASACPGANRPFAPSFRAGVADKSAGAHSTFSLVLERNDGDQNLTGITVTTPPGFSASLRGVPYCSEAGITRVAGAGYSGLLEQVSPACPPASQIGTATAGAGAGSHPVHVGGTVYLAGPYRGAPLSLVVVVPAVSGPYDLGNIAVRSAIHLDPITAQVTAVTDPLPQIIEGVPLRTRLIQVSLDRPGFALNPTNCEPLAVDAVASGDEGAAASLRTPFQVANCADLEYTPKLNLRLRGSMKRRGHPSIQATLITRPGEANSRWVAVTLPKGGLLDNAHIETICTRAQFASDSCPEGSRIGRAEARTAILDQPLSGAVYLRASSNKLPDMVVDLEGQIDVQLVGKIDSVRGRLRTTFGSVPDAPVERFTLNLHGGKKGLLINSINLCARPRWADVRMTGQNRIRSQRNTKLQTKCGNGNSSKRRLHRAEEVR